MLRPEDIQEAIATRVFEVAVEHGEEAAEFYKLGFIECVQFMIDIKKHMDRVEGERLATLFSKADTKKKTSGLN